MEKQLTLYQRLTKMFGNDSKMPVDYNKHNHQSYNLDGKNVLYRTKNKEDYEMNKLELKQGFAIAKGYKTAAIDVSMRNQSSLTDVQMMYRDADLMDGFPEIGTAMDILMEESTYIGPSGFMVNVHSKSPRIKSVLEDLLVNRLSINTLLPPICRSTIKYGNTFMLLDISKENGIIGWLQLPVAEMYRFDYGVDNPYNMGFSQPSNFNLSKENSTRFVWMGQNNEYTPYWNWQIAHFRLMYDTMFLPYGMSYLNKARRHWRMLSMMEDMMLLYRMERSVERRVFKVNVAGIETDDVPAFVDIVANGFKRTPIIDPMTGQLDLRKSVLSGLDDYFIPVRTPDEPSPIESLAGAQNLTAMDDIKYVQNKVCCALRVPLSYLNFEEEKGEGKNLSLLDVRFAKTINRVQQFLLMELNKICIIHLYLLGFTDELTNFNLTMNNPSTQSEMMEIENLGKKITTAKDAVTPPGEGLSVMSFSHAWKQILGWSEQEIAENLEELRLESAMAAELGATGNIIKHTGVFDKVDNIYKDPNAELNGGGVANGDENGGMANMGGGGMPNMGGMPDMGGADMPDMGGAGEMDMNSAAGEDAAGGAPPLMEILNKKQTLLNESKNNLSKHLIERKKHYNELLKEHKKTHDEECCNRIVVPLLNKAFFINEELDSVSKQLNEWIDDNKNKN